MSAGTQTKHFIVVNDGVEIRVKGSLFDELKQEPNTLIFVDARDTDNYRLSQTLLIPTVSGQEFDEIVGAWVAKGYTKKGSKTFVRFIQTERKTKQGVWE